MDVFERFKLTYEISNMIYKNIIFIVVEPSAQIDCHPMTETNAEMGILYEYLNLILNDFFNEALGKYTSHCETPFDLSKISITRLKNILAELFNVESERRVSLFSGGVDPHASAVVRSM